MPYKDKLKQREFQRIWMSERRKAWVAVNGPCRLCGSSIKLEVDHIDPLTKRYNPRALWSMSDNNPNKIDELAKCQVLCHRCHKEKTFNGDLPR